MKYYDSAFNLNARMLKRGFKGVQNSVFSQCVEYCLLNTRKNDSISPKNNSKSSIGDCY